MKFSLLTQKHQLQEKNIINSKFEIYALQMDDK